MELKRYLEVLARRRWVIVATVVICLTVAAIGTRLMIPQYEGVALLRVTPVVTSLDDTLGWDEIQYSDRLMNTYIQIIRSDAILQEWARHLNRAEPPKVEVETPANTELLWIRVEDSDPRLAADGANMLAEMLIAHVQDQDQRRIAYITSATIPTEPISPRPTLNLLAALALGAFAGVGFAFLFENLDTTLNTTSQIQRVTGLLPRGTIPVLRDRTPNTQSPQKEAFRQLRTNLFTGLSNRAPIRLLATSATPGEGKSTVVSNLATVIGEIGQKVVVVDCDLRTPTLHTIFHLANESGISNVLQGDATLEDVIRSSSATNVWVVTSGSIVDRPAELLGTDAMRRVIDQLSQQFDVVLLDSPSALPVADPFVLAALVDAVLLVVSRTQAQEELVGATCQQLAMIGDGTVHLVVNRAESVPHHAYSSERATA